MFFNYNSASFERVFTPLSWDCFNFPNIYLSYQFYFLLCVHCFLFSTSTNLYGSLWLGQKQHLMVKDKTQEDQEDNAHWEEYRLLNFLVVQKTVCTILWSERDKVLHPSYSCTKGAKPSHALIKGYYLLFL